VKAPAGLDPDMLTVIEIVRHAAEIVSRMPLAAVKAHLGACFMTDPASPWYEAARRLIESAQLLELDGGRLSALEARTEVMVAPDVDVQRGDIPDDWTTG
jgi:hypothetical protein